MMTTDEICALTLAEASNAVRNGNLSPLDLTRACLDRITRLDDRFNSFICIYKQKALNDAEALAAELKSGRYRGPLHGIPIALKDLIDVAGEITTAASAVLLANRAEKDAEIVRRLKAAGAVILGKANLHEFAYGGSGMIGQFGVVRNPIDPRYITGGSSSGSAAAVAANFCFAAIGTDTAGSIRLPAAYCGIVGLKPTHGALDTTGVVSLAWSYDHLGPMARTVRDAAIMWRVLSGDERPSPEFKTLRIGIARNFFFDSCDPEIAAAVESVARKLHAREVGLPVNEDRTLSNAEAYRYHQQFLAEKADLYQQETLRRVRSGENITEESYLQRRRELEDLRRGAPEFFQDVDVVITPTAPIPPSLISELQENPAALRPRELMMLKNTRPFNVWGVPTVSVPCGRTSVGFPIGIQLASAPGREDVLLAAAAQVEEICS